jgi:hypothetical protein
MSLANAFGQNFNMESVRTRSFKLNGHEFKVKVPLTSEMEAMYERAKIVDEAKAVEYYANLSKEFVENREKYEADSEVVFKEDDILVKNISLRETSRNKVLTENRILELVRFLVPEDKNFDMGKITYAEIDELFPFSVQMELIEEINAAISPGYVANRGK